MIQHIIFDCDGVLIDTEIVAAEVVVNWFTTQQLNISVDEFIHQHTGKMFSNILKELQLAGQLPADLDTPAVMHQLESEIRNNMRPISGVNSLLESLHLPKSVVSNSDVSYVQEALNKFDLVSHFNTPIFSAELVAQGKPSPMVYELASKTIGVNKQSLVAIEDSYTGVQAATAAGITTIGFLGGSHIRDGHGQRLESLGVHALARDHQELGQILADMLTD